MADTKKRFEVKVDGLTVGGRMYKAGDTFGYADVTSVNRERVWEMLEAGDLDDRVTLVTGDDLHNEDDPALLSTDAPEQPQGEPDEPVTGEQGAEAQQAKEYETSGASASADVFIDEEGEAYQTPYEASHEDVGASAESSDMTAESENEENKSGKRGRKSATE